MDAGESGVYRPADRQDGGSDDSGFAGMGILLDEKKTVKYNDC